MLSFSKKRFLEERIKPILLLQVILVFCAIIVYIQTYNKINYFYSGILNIIAGVIFLINGIDIYNLKKRGYIVWLFFSVIWFGLALQNFFFKP
ncbi:hypothetical protein [Cytobacillus firmus]|uniref:hypothetical protein n=1 Tax=Cytobacillus firmus TaxID=1399 RepID=UPI0018CDEBE2|nr:hypothetical protein [Cytobacillus firmus]MBG9587251.1 hypothetical protein [Cytobacillus firmus]